VSNASGDFIADLIWRNNRHSPKKSDVDNYKALRCIALLCLFVKVFGFEDCHQTGEFLQRK
jgi:hypothetical protein